MGKYTKTKLISDILWKIISGPSSEAEVWKKALEMAKQLGKEVAE